MAEQITIFDFLRQDFSVNNKIRLIELFAGYGSQAMALRNLGADFEHYRVVEFDKYAIASYNAIHGTDFPEMDIKDVKGVDLGIEDRERFTYLLTPSLVRTFQSPEEWLVCQRIAKLGQVFCGKSGGCLLRLKTIFRRYLLWRTFRLYTTTKTGLISGNG